MIAGLTDYIGSVFLLYNISIPVIIRNVNVAGMDPLSFRKHFDRFICCSALCSCIPVSEQGIEERAFPINHLGTLARCRVGPSGIGNNEALRVHECIALHSARCHNRIAIIRIRNHIREHCSRRCADCIKIGASKMTAVQGHVSPSRYGHARF